MAKLKPSLIAIYASVFALVVVMVAIGYHEPQRGEAVANTAAVNASALAETTSVDEVMATDVAASVAQTANLPVAPSVLSLAISTQTKSDFIQSNGSGSLKPQLVGSDGVRSITVHTVKAGDTVDSVAAKYGISAQTLKWANDLTSDSLVEGSKLQIPPIDGVIYTVKSGDTIASIAERYNVDKERLVLFNDLDLSGLKTGSKITLPSATLPNTERPGYVAPVQQPTYYYAGTGAGFGGNTWHIKVGTPMLSGNTYAYGNCTAYAYDRRVQMGMSAYARMGNAAEWAVNWPNQGAISRTPSVGAIMQSGGGFGHVAIVEKLLPNGDIQISEMNAYVSGGGFNIVSGRTVLAGNVGSYLYIR